MFNEIYPLNMHVFLVFVYSDKACFLCINICWTPKVVLKPEPKGEGFNDSLWGLGNVSASEKTCLIVIIA